MSTITRAPVIALLIVCGRLFAGDYDPLKVASDAQSTTHDLSIHDAARDRDIPVRVYLPSVTKPSPVVLFSHGLGGNREGSAFLGKHWSARGYVGVFLQHPGSDDSVWRGVPLARRMAAMNEAASAKNYQLRVADVAKVLDQLQVWDKESGHVLAGRMDLSHVGMSGHSFGAQTTQAVSGQSIPILGQRYTDERIQAAIAFSPSIPPRGNLATAFGAVRIPWMLMTGTKDDSPIGNSSPESRTKVYPALPDSIDKYEIVLFNAEHSAFSDRALPGDVEKRNPNHHRVILALSTAFWDTHLRADPGAREWLHGTGAKSILESQDRWQLQLRKERSAAERNLSR